MELMIFQPQNITLLSSYVILLMLMIIGIPSLGGSYLFDLKQTNIDPNLLIDEMSKGFLLLEASPAQVRDPGTYVIRRTNPSFIKMFDIHNDYLGETLANLSPISDALTIELVNVMTSAEASSYEIYDDELDRWFMLSIFRPLELFIAIVSEEITEKKKIEEKLAESEKTMRLTLDVAGEGLWQWRVEDELIHHNKRWNSIMGFSTDTKTHSLDEFVGCVHPEDREKVKRLNQRVFKHFEPYSNEHRVITQDGRTVWIRDRGVPIVSSEGKLERVIGSLTDITRYKETQQQLHLEKEILQSTLLSVGDGIIATDAVGKIKMINPAAERALGCKQEDLHELIVTEIFQFVDPVTRELYSENPYEELRDNEKIGKNVQAEIVITETGKRMHIFFNVTRINLPDGEKVGYIIVFSDITPMVERQKRIEYLSFHDELTGLYNRRYLIDAMHRLDSPHNLPFTIMILDLNGLKGINDTYGHASGDLLLQKTAEFLESIFRQNDIIARIGGDEFCILLPQTNEAAAKKIIDRIKHVPNDYDSAPEQISISVGFAVKTDPKENIDAVIRKADVNMFKDKGLCRNH